MFMSVFKSAAKFTSVLIDVAPHLRNILETIIKSNNSPNLTDDQWSVLSVELGGFINKLERFGLDVSRVRVIMGEGKEKHLKMIQEIKHLLSNFEKTIKEEHLVPIMDQALICQQPNVTVNTERFVKKVFKELEPTFRVSVCPIVSSTIKFGRHALAAKLLEDAMLAMARTIPSRKICAGGSLFVRDVDSFVIAGEPSFLDNLAVALPHYRVINPTSLEAGQFYHREFIPKQAYLTEEICQTLYLKSANEMTIYDILYNCYSRIDSVADEYRNSQRIQALVFDKHYGPEALYYKIIGSSISSLDFAYDVMELVGGLAYSKVTSDPISSVRSKYALFHITDFRSMIAPGLLGKVIRSNNINPIVISKVHELIYEEIYWIRECFTKNNMYTEIVNQLLSSVTRPNLSYEELIKNFSNE